jgi:ubiquitin C-terminal hydrolase
LERESYNSSPDPQFTSQRISDYLVREILQIGRRTGLSLLFSDYLVQENLQIGHKTGLKNQGRTCYMNAVLQQLIAIPEIRAAVLDSQPPDEDTDDHGSKQLMSDNTLHQNARGQRQRDDTRNSYNMIRELRATFQCLQAKKTKTHDPISLVQACRVLGMRYSPFKSNDPHEFLSLLIPQLEKWINADPSGTHKDAIENCLGGCTRTVKTCKKCGLHTVTQSGTFKDLIVAVRPTLEECLSDFVKANNTCAECARCKERTLTSKTDTVCKLPQVTKFLCYAFSEPCNCSSFSFLHCYVLSCV